MKENAVKNKSFVFAIQIVNLYKILCSEHHEYDLSKQLLRSGTAIGALIREAEYSESKLDFIHKNGLAQKEANETIYCLELLNATGYLPLDEFDKLNHLAIELLKLLTSKLNHQKTL